MIDLNKKWTFAANEEDYSPIIDWFETKEEAIEEGKNVYDKESFIVTQLKLINLPSPDVISVLEKLEEDYINSICVDENLLSPFDNITKEGREWLQDQLDLLIGRFYEKEKIESNYYEFYNIEHIQGE